MRINSFKHTIFFIIAVILLNIVSHVLYKRFDLTKDGRYTLSNTTITLIKSIDEPLIIDVFLEGDFSSDFRLLKTETQQIIDEFQQYTNNIVVNYINPIQEETTRERNIKELTKAGLEPYIASNQNTSKLTQEILFPWAYASYKEKKVKIPLLKQSITEPITTQIDHSIEGLEYTFTNAFNQLISDKSKTVAVLKGNSELSDIYIADFLKTIKPHYNIAPFTLDSATTKPLETLEQLNTYDLILVAKPNDPFSETEKLILDQYTMNGGKSLWLTEAVFIDKDSLKNDSGSTVATIKDLNLNDFFFKYGIRINPNLVKDLYSAPITLSIGQGSKTQLQPIQWPYSPLAAANPDHPVTKNLNLVKFDFASQIDTLKNSVSKTILLQSSPQSKLEGVPKAVSLSQITNSPNETSYNQGSKTLSVLLEGKFTSVYKQRVLPFKLNSSFKTESEFTRMIIISDGDIIKNDLYRNQPQELGFDRLTGKAFGNKEFLLNAINYLLDDNGLIHLRSKDIAQIYLDTDSASFNKTYWQLLNILLPLLVLGVFGISFNYFRKKHFHR